MRTLTLAVALTLGLTSCSLLGDDETADAPTAPAQTNTDTETDAATTSDDTERTSAMAAPAPTTPVEVVLVTHDSFTVPEELVAQFEADTGFQLQIQLAGDAGQLTNQISLTAGSPVADVTFGVDNTYAGRAVEAAAFAAYTPSGLPGSAAEHALPDEGAAYLTPVDFGDVCVNVDNVWFANNGLVPPQTLRDLTKPEYDDLFVTPGASTSSPGMAFLLATVGEFGPTEWQGYWEDLMANGAKVTSGWTDAYTVDFTAGGGGGDRPIVLSYASSPPSTIPEGFWEPTTSALLDTCFRQVEYAGVLEGAANPQGAQAVVDWLVSPEVQASIPDSMYMYPVDDEVPLPELWAQFAPLAEQPIVVHPGQIEEQRETWLREWADIATG
ncbi:thiamine ABC transporter substrate binding subunit [Ornithinimicrobium sp. LYQ103]|uniref:thiamine ABC transporter substrate-binding protein n=1 Tax=Ornithinimicrobium sp. LYQ103 TaxID=3378796 RepID=UPI003854A09D